MKSYTLSIILIGFISLVFNKCSYNLANNTLESLYSTGDIGFIDKSAKIEQNQNAELHLAKHKINLVTFLNQNLKKKDSLFLSKQDSLISSISSTDKLILSKIINEQVYVQFIQNFKTNLIQNISNPRQKEIDFLNDQIIKLQDAVRKNTKNNVARHNLEVLTKLKQHADFYYKKAHQLSELIYRQLEDDIKRDSLTFFDYSKQGYLKNYEKKIEEIRTDIKKSKCIVEVTDSLNSLINSQLVIQQNEETIDSLRLYDNIDLELIEKLKKGNSTEQIVNDFYNKDYPELYGKSSQDVFQRILKDERTNKTVQEVISKYLDPDQKQEKNEDQENNKDQNKDQEKNKEQKNNQDSKDQKDKNKEDQQGKGKEKKDKDDKSNSEKLKEEQKKKSKSAQKDVKKDQMKEHLGDLDKKKNEEKSNSTYNQQPESENNKEQKAQNDKQEEKPTNGSQAKFKEHNMTKNSAEQTLKSLEQKSDKYLQNQKRAQQRDLEYGTKPDW